ncbi:MAG: carbohydrate ABC transporter permease, partial [Enterococcus hulanensis]
MKKKKFPVSLILLVLFTFIFLFPIYWTITTAMKQPGQIMVIPPEFIPSKISLQNFRQVIAENNMGQFFWNSLSI